MTEKNHITEKILNLTLEIIYLLTGEDYSQHVGKHVGTMCGSPCQPGGLYKTVSAITDPPPLSEVRRKNDHQKILDLTNKIIHLLTGEVPIRHEDIIVCFSMEEWKYLEGHKDLYKDVLMEDDPFLGCNDFPSNENLSMKLNSHTLSPDTTSEDHLLTLYKPKAKSNVEDLQDVTLRIKHDQFTDFSTCTQYTQTEPVDSGKGVLSEDNDDDVVFVPTENTLVGYSTDPPRSYNEGSHKDSDFCLLTEQIQNTSDQVGTEVESNGVLAVDNIYSPTCLKSTDLTDQPTKWVTNVNFVGCPITPHQINTQYTPNCFIEVASVCEEGNVTNTDVYTATDHNKMEEIPMSWGKGVMYTDIYTAAELTQADLASIKKELVSWEEGNLELQTIYIPPKPMVEKTVSTNGRVKAAQWNGSQAHRDSYPSLENTLPHIKTEYEQGDFADHYATPEQSQPTPTPFNPEDCHMEAIKKERVNTNVSVTGFTTDDENDNSTSANATSQTLQMYSCSDCKKCFSNDTNLAKHRLMCRGRKPHVCSGCGKCFASASYLVIHERIHTGEKPYACSHCGKSFTRKPDLIRHERIHTGEKPFACPECGKCFTSVSNIFMHRRIHTGEKPFPCAECGKRFIKKSDLVRHERIHETPKPLSCRQCGKYFCSKSILNKHMAVHTGKRPETDQGGS
ncbi:oocyte zinc finger protein XlCOF7.1-like [Hyla sarda]|uniref:oocyte zinc finger protein XlCOF7.1-like n=1 Tax=Hyla sarda TaxID=327740 RepID=UPI0024C2D2AC|nr:oocyte zinc finger protein XlCOF7.1-like [Hyla sarda]XP_056387742.1 oocyte zinc finger protein XlCOF7.1-like [Hyla sarda]XP_056387743.1 oocyte zinc finger protein XlCOF7.1-like [Hyla sarda]XP_056387745.1 oocyte zinc finger protein XlCOF7.1-like [Hyla sarda]